MPLFVGELSVFRLRGSRRLSCGLRRRRPQHRHVAPNSYDHHHRWGQNNCGHLRKVQSNFGHRWGPSNCGFRRKAQSKFGHRLHKSRYWERAGA